MEDNSIYEKYPNYLFFKLNKKEQRIVNSIKEVKEVAEVQKDKEVVEIEKEDEFTEVEKDEKFKGIRDNCRKIQIKQIIGEYTCNHIIEITIPFPEDYPAYELVESTSVIKELSTSMLKDILLISGKIHKKISYINYEGSYFCQYSDLNIECFMGSIKTVSIDIPFSCSLRISDIQVGDKINFDFDKTDTSNFIDILDNPVFIHNDNVILYKSLKEKLIVNIELEVLRTVETDI